MYWLVFSGHLLWNNGRVFKRSFFGRIAHFVPVFQECHEFWISCACTPLTLNTKCLIVLKLRHDALLKCNFFFEMRHGFVDDWRKRVNVCTWIANIVRNALAAISTQYTHLNSAIPLSISFILSLPLSLFLSLSACLSICVPLCLCIFLFICNIHTPTHARMSGMHTHIQNKVIHPNHAVRRCRFDMGFYAKDLERAIQELRNELAKLWAMHSQPTSDGFCTYRRSVQHLCVCVYMRSSCMLRGLDDCTDWLWEHIIFSCMCWYIYLCDMKSTRT